MKSEENSTGKTWKQRQLLSESKFVLHIHIAPPPLSRDWRIKMKKSKIIKSKRLNDDAETRTKNRERKAH